MFRTNERVFKIWRADKGRNFWYFQAREGVMGPFDSDAEARNALASFIQRCIAMKDDGGRGAKEASAHGPKGV